MNIINTFPFVLINIQMFFGTPHCGANKRQWKLVANQLSPFAGSIHKGKAAPLVKAIIRDAEDLSEIEEDFRPHAEKYKIITFYETELWRNTGALIIDKTSALMGIENEVVPVEGDHLTMCYFEDAEDPVFIQVCQLMEEDFAKVPTPVHRQTWVEIVSVEELDEGVGGLEDNSVVQLFSVKAIENKEVLEEFPWRVNQIDDEVRVEVPAHGAGATTGPTIAAEESLDDVSVNAHIPVWGREGTARPTTIPAEESHDEIPVEKEKEYEEVLVEVHVPAQDKRATAEPPAPAKKTELERKTQGEADEKEDRPMAAMTRRLPRFLRRWLE